MESISESQAHCISERRRRRLLHFNFCCYCFFTYYFRLEVVHARVWGLSLLHVTVSFNWSCAWRGREGEGGVSCVCCVLAEKRNECLHSDTHSRYYYYYVLCRQVPGDTMRNRTSLLLVLQFEVNILLVYSSSSTAFENCIRVSRDRATTNDRTMTHRVMQQTLGKQQLLYCHKVKSGVYKGSIAVFTYYFLRS